MFNIKALFAALFKKQSDSNTIKINNKQQSSSKNSKKFKKDGRFAASLLNSNIIALSQFDAFVSMAPFCYKCYEIAKRNNRGMRTIAQPSKDLKIVQSFCVELLRRELPVHAKALAYEVGTGIKQNAQLHVKNEYLLKMDFKDFFASITPLFFRSVVQKHGLSFSEDDFILLTRLLFWRPKKGAKDFELSIGAPSSPFVSNAVMYFFDKAMEEECARRWIVYSRYADDLTFSTQHKGVLFAIPELVEEYLKRYCFAQLAINQEKTVFSSKKFNRHVTGVTITNDSKLSLGLSRKRYLRSLVHQFKLGQLKLEQVELLQGYLGHAKHIEPEFVSSLQRKYGRSVLDEIFAVV